MKRFFYLCAALLCLSLAFHFGYTTAMAQAPGNPIVAMPSSDIVVTANGDVYHSTNGVAGPWALYSNVFSSGPTPALHQTWGQLKSRYAPTTEQTRPAAPQDK